MVRGHPSLVPDCRGKAFSYAPLSTVLAEGLSYMAFVMLRHVPPIPITRSALIINGCCILSNAYSAPRGKIM